MGVKSKLEYIKKKGFESLEHDGIKTLSVKAVRYVYREAKHKLNPPKKTQDFKDVLFINGCTLDHPSRYRVEHQKEQLQANNMSCDVVWYQHINEDLLKYYRTFIIFRCPITDELREFIKKGKYFNKVFFYDIDDLVIDEKYVKTIDHLKKLSKDELALYMDGVKRCGDTLKLCDYAITTTPALAKELENYVPEVFINRNVVSEEMIHICENILKNQEAKTDNKIYIGYLSGSITHNPDFELIKPAIKKVLREFKNVNLVIAGYLDLPEDLKEFESQITRKPFVPWRKLPNNIASLDINLAPIEDSLFNRAKSENKWTEASMLKVATVASNVGAFAEIIKNREDGILCENTEKGWYEAIKELVQNEELRKNIALNSYKRVMKNHVTIYTGTPLKRFIESKLNKNIGIVVPSTFVRGGLNVIVKHANVLRDNGYDVLLISEDKPNENVKVKDGELLAVSRISHHILGCFDTMVATLWTTVPYVEHYPKCTHKLYFVQNYETDFYVHGDARKQIANSTYLSEQLSCITISKWCQNWLKDVFEKDSKYCPNGMDLQKFSLKEKDWSGKIKILIEGNSIDEYKNVDESFKVANQLDKNKFEVCYLSYDKGPKSWYKVDKFYQAIPYDEVAKIYQDCHILIKSSKVESFSYPPIEMMATGGVAVVGLNGGNAEYVKHEENSMVYEIGNIDEALEYVMEVVRNEELRMKLIKNGLATAKSREWSKLTDQIIELYK